MLTIILTVALSVWLTSSLLMVGFYLNAKFAYARENKGFKMPLRAFLYYHFCPIVHTIKCLHILNRMFELKRQRGM